MSTPNFSSRIPWACLAPTALTVVLAACGGGGGGSSSSSGGGGSESARYVVPSEISAVPAATSDSNSPAAPRGFGGAIRALAKAATADALPSGSDYAQAKGKTYVEERTLEQFDIIEQVFSAVGQTGYADMVDQGPYKAVISWEDEQDGRDIKQLQTWTVRADLVSGTLPSGSTGNYLRLRAWIPETDPSGNENLIKAQFNIYEDATQADDGSFTDFGSWDMNVLFAADPTAVDGGVGAEGYFAAEARKSSSGSTLKIHEVAGAREFGASSETKAILVRDGDSGYGQVEYPDFDSCWADFEQNGDGDPNNYNCNLQSVTAQYAYTERDFALSTDGGTTVAYKDRNLSGAVKMVHRYGLYYADAGTDNGVTHAEGEDVLKQMSFGFPVTYQASVQGGGTYNAFAYYGAWQGRHQLWGPGGYTAEGNGTATEFTRADSNADTPPTYTVVEFPGTLSKREVVDASLADVKNVSSQVFVNSHYDLFWDNGNSRWTVCDGFANWANNPVTCDGRDGTQNVGFTDFTGQLSTLERQANDSRWINIGYWDNIAQQPVDLVYLTTDPGVQGFTFAGSGFYKAEWGNEGAMAPILDADGGGQIDTNVVTQLWADIGGSIYVEYVGFAQGSGSATGWVQKTFTGYSQQTGAPEFSENGDTPFSPSRSAEYYMNVNGSNFIVKRKAAADAADSYDVKLELQTAAHPGNTDSASSLTILPATTSYLAYPWDQSVRYYLEEDPSDAEYLQLLVKADDSGTKSAGDTLDEGKWGLVAWYDNGTAADLTDDVMLTTDGTQITDNDLDEFGFPTGNTRPAEFNWEKPQSWESWGKQQFLKDSDGNYVVLSDPILLNDVGVVDSIDQTVYLKDANGNDTATAKTFDLQYDGWLHGLPNMYGVLADNDWNMIPAIADKVWHVKAGTKVTDSNGVEYFIKPLDTSLFLGGITEQSITDAGRTPPSLAEVATGADLTSVPTYTAHQMGATPAVDDDGAALQVKYSEGKLLE